MLHLIKDIADNFFNFLSQDPVRPSIPHAQRVGPNRDVFVLKEDQEVKAITCVSYQDTIPTTENELFAESAQPTVAVFYTIWSYAPGAGRQLIFDSVKHIQTRQTNIQRFVTLSPKTEMAKRFHLKNGACVFKENNETVNYEYINNHVIDLQGIINENQNSASR
jgi:hypothetical protein